MFTLPINYEEEQWLLQQFTPIFLNSGNNYTSHQSYKSVNIQFKEDFKNNKPQFVTLDINCSRFAFATENNDSILILFSFSSRQSIESFSDYLNTIPSLKID